MSEIEIERLKTPSLRPPMTQWYRGLIDLGYKNFGSNEIPKHIRYLNIRKSGLPHCGFEVRKVQDFRDNFEDCLENAYKDEQKQAKSLFNPEEEYKYFVVVTLANGQRERLLGIDKSQAKIFFQNKSFDNDDWGVIEFINSKPPLVSGNLIIGRDPKEIIVELVNGSHSELGSNKNNFAFFAERRQFYDMNQRMVGRDSNYLSCLNLHLNEDNAANSYEYLVRRYPGFIHDFGNAKDFYTQLIIRVINRIPCMHQPGYFEFSFSPDLRLYFFDALDYGMHEKYFK